MILRHPLVRPHCFFHRLELNPVLKRDTLIARTMRAVVNLKQPIADDVAKDDKRRSLSHPLSYMG